MKYILSLLIPLSIFAKSSFITPMEYASQLYKNPRGIGCHNCHGEKGEGRLVATYIHNNEKRSFRGPPINKVKFNKFVKALSEGKRGMPRYFLTSKEIQALYLYINKTQVQER